MLLDVLRDSVLITGLVVILMMMIECFNVESGGRVFTALRRTRAGQVLFSAFLGSIPGCVGGFASVSLYTHGLLSFGALTAMMIASSGDEAFVMLAMIPDKAWWIFLVLFGIAVIAGLAVDYLGDRGVKWFGSNIRMHCDGQYEIHEDDVHHHGNGHGHSRHFGWRRCVMFTGVAVFIAALLGGLLEEEGEEAAGSIFTEEWLYYIFAALSLVVLGVLIFGQDHFVEGHLWKHIVLKHLPSVFGWTAGVLLLISCLLGRVDIASWISDNTPLMILLATLIGIIPESGPHMIFVTLYATGIVPLPVLLASCISQDGHASLPLIAESKRGFLRAKTVNVAAALAVGFITLALFR